MQGSASGNKTHCLRGSPPKDTSHAFLLAGAAMHHVAEALIPPRGTSRTKAGEGS